MRLSKKTVKDFIWKYWVVGVITSQDEILSICDDFNRILMHGDYYPLVQKRWRWDYQNGLKWSTAVEITKEDAWRVREYLTERYNIRFWNNGYHDLDYFKELQATKSD